MGSLARLLPRPLRQAWSLENSLITSLTLHPTRDFGLPLHALSTVRGGPSSQNASTLLALLTNSAAPPAIFPPFPTEDAPSFDAIRDFILLNASAVLVVAGKASSFVEGVTLARKSMEDGGAMEALEGFRRTAKEALEAVGKE